MKMRTKVLRIQADNELMGLIAKASKITGLSKSEVARQSIRLGAAELVPRCNGMKPSLMDCLADFRGWKFLVDALQSSANHELTPINTNEDTTRTSYLAGKFDLLIQVFLIRVNSCPFVV
jgi:hypothetical protein